MADWRSTICRHAYSREDWAAVVALLPVRPEPEQEARFRFNIECSAYSVRSGWTGPPTKRQWIAHCQKAAVAVGKARDALAVIIEDNDLEQIDAWCSIWIAEANDRKRRWENSPSARRKNNNPAVAQLVRQLLGLWTHCGGKVRLSTGAPGARDEGRPKGPLLKFLKTATIPIYAASGRPALSDNRARTPDQKRARSSKPQTKRRRFWLMTGARLGSKNVKLDRANNR